MTFLTISQEAQGLLSFWVSLVEILLFFNFFRYVQLGKGRSNVRCIALTIVNFALAQVMFQHMDGNMVIPIVLPILKKLFMTRTA